MKKIVLTLLPLTIFLSGCLYPNNELRENQFTNDQQLEQVQDAVKTYQEQNNGLLPIQTRDDDTPLFIKYPVDFNTLRNQNLIGSTPGNAYEKGGVYSYVIIDPEEEATVKVADARVTQHLRSVIYDVTVYKKRNGSPPYGEQVGEGHYMINEERLNTNHETTVSSPYSDMELDIIVNVQGDVLIDYRPEVYQLIENEGIEKYSGDLRYLLMEYHPMVPVYSSPMVLEDGEIEFTNEVE
ncbi:hypothetical protein CEY16_03625 [Halalkalibacillus sediminis]|uniref:ABC transporter periplasmic binding protein yphF n=1 Tax=Halalkalibacillus sediminis TaxID=2018042 RepID=A0A2I0QWX8_9BACI|nr:hypothetical protein [Halalkalibacillus sediminis]PKR78856.1 hypothetical protein CEY16_03625 [Halalkalibacillus sediminis]